MGYRATSFLCWASLLPILLAEHALAEDPPAEPTEVTTIIVKAPAPSGGALSFGRAAEVLDRRDLERRLSATLGETLELEPGVRSSFFGPGASRPIVRGFSGDRLKVMTDGLGTGDVSEISEDHLVSADPSQADAIELVRGPESLRYGNSSIGGSVNVVGKDIPENFLPSPFETEIFGAVGSNADDERSVGASFLGELNRTPEGSVTVRTSGFYRSTNDYRIPGFAESSQLRESESEDGDHSDEDEIKGKVPNTSSETYGATVGSSYIWDQGFFGLSLNALDSDYGIPGHAHTEEHTEDHMEADHQEADHDSEEEESVRIDAKSLRLALRGRVNNVSELVEATQVEAAVTRYRHSEIENGEVSTRFERNTFESRFELVHRPFKSPLGALNGSWGVQFTYDDFSATGEEVYLEPTRSTTPALFVFEKASLLKDLRLELGGRVEFVHRDPLNADSQSFVPYSISLGPVWDFGQDASYSVALSLARTERAPSATELFAFGPHLARQIFEVGDSNLSIEKSWGADLAFRKNTGLITGAVTPFIQHFSEYIDLSATDEFIDDLPVYDYQSVEALFIGFEFSSTLHLNRLLNLSRDELLLHYQLDFLRARNESADDPLARIPPLRNIVRAEYLLGSQFDSSLEAVFVSEQDRVSDFETTTDGYTMFNAELGYTPTILPSKSSEERPRVFLRATNLTNEEARVHSSFLKDLAPLRGRAFLVGVRGTF